ncbi:MAG: hypothetical protein K0B07_05400 [DPANN group archaeon]|nr:hypothetical protein [DPANN group archaeon]
MDEIEKAILENKLLEAAAKDKSYSNRKDTYESCLVRLDTMKAGVTGKNALGSSEYDTVIREGKKHLESINLTQYSNDNLKNQLRSYLKNEKIIGTGTPIPIGQYETLLEKTGVVDTLIEAERIKKGQLERDPKKNSLKGIIDIIE